MGAAGSYNQSDVRLASPFGGRQLITRKVAAAILGVDVKTLKAMRETRVIPGVRTASGEYRFSETDIRAYLNRANPVRVDREVGAAPPSRPR
jgi:hypothetical protein